MSVGCGASTSECPSGPRPVPQAMAYCPGLAAVARVLMTRSVAELKFWMMAAPVPPWLMVKKPGVRSTTVIGCAPTVPVVGHGQRTRAGRHARRDDTGKLIGSRARHHVDHGDVERTSAHGDFHAGAVHRGGDGKPVRDLHAARTERAASGRGLDDEHAAVRHAAIRVVRRDVASGVRNRSGIDLQILRQAGTRQNSKMPQDEMQIRAWCVIVLDAFTEPPCRCSRCTATCRRCAVHSRT